MFLKEFAEWSGRLVSPLRKNGQILEVIPPFIVFGNASQNGLPLFFGERPQRGQKNFGSCLRNGHRHHSNRLLALTDHDFVIVIRHRTIFNQAAQEG
ncbi:MAG: hypothetical protein KKE86_02010 [Planctomycetes bacterium]|nr:hypothetical protein [Planctomycetota bacterium]